MINTRVTPPPLPLSRFPAPLILPFALLHFPPPILRSPLLHSPGTPPPRSLFSSLSLTSSLLPLFLSLSLFPSPTESGSFGMSSKNKGGGQEAALVKMLERLRVQKAAVDAAKNWRMQKRGQPQAQDEPLRVPQEQLKRS
jgi:hypothetical protein